jgi:hypothetical protein
VNILHRIWTSIAAAFGFPGHFSSHSERDTDADAGPTISPVVEITPEELAAKVRTIIPEPEIEITTINPEYGSWNLRVRKGKLDMEYIWLGPDGFGGMDHARPMTPDDTPFDLVDEVFQSVDEALEYLRKLAGKYECAVPRDQRVT